MPEIGKRIRTIRKELGLSQQKFGERIKISKSHVSNIESGGDYPSDMLIKLICMEFDINEGWLRSGEGSQKRELGIDNLLNNMQNKILEELLLSLNSLQPLKKDEALKCLRELTRLITYVYSDKGYSPIIAKPSSIINTLATIYGMVTSFKHMSDTFDETLIQEHKNAIKSHLDILVKNMTGMIDRLVNEKYIGEEDETREEE